MASIYSRVWELLCFSLCQNDPFSSCCSFRRQNKSDGSKKPSRHTRLPLEYQTKQILPKNSVKTSMTVSIQAKHKGGIMIH